MNSHELTRSLRQEAQRLGFDHCKITPIADASHADFFEAWLGADRAGEMSYLSRNIDKRRNPTLLLNDTLARSMIVLGVNHFQFQLPSELRDDPSRGIIASYAWGDDYHELIRPLLYELDAFICRQTGRTTRAKCLVDTGPVLERDWAQSAGLGFTGKNCCTIHPRDGSWLLLATIIVPEGLAFDPIPEPSAQPASLHEPGIAALMAGLPAAHEVGAWRISLATDESTIGTCGRCTRCIDACPTDAFIGPFHLDPQQCISYWTIEASSPIPQPLRTAFGNRIFGCDICQEVCPWNSRLSPRTTLIKGLRAQDDRIAIPLLEGFDPATPYWLDQAAFSARFRRSPIKRAKRHGMLRNICVALGNWADPTTVDALAVALADDEPLVRGHAAWALGRILVCHRIDRVHNLLTTTLQTEKISWVREELHSALT